MNETFEQMVVRVADEVFLKPNGVIEFATRLRDELAKGQEPVAFLRFWARQYYSGHGNIEHDEGLETCGKDDIGDDGIPAFPVFCRPLVAAPAGVPDVDWLANVIRAADGNHIIGAGALAEKIVEAMLSAAPAAPDHISQPVKMVEPFGYLKAEPFGWTDCSEEDEGAIPLYDKKTVDELIHAAISAYMEKN